MTDTSEPVQNPIPGPIPVTDNQETDKAKIYCWRACLSARRFVGKAWSCL